MEARDYGRQQKPREWALFTGRYETAYLMERLMAQPCAEQFSNKFCLEWPMLEVCRQFVILSTRHSKYKSLFTRLIPVPSPVVLCATDTKCSAAVQ